MVMNEAVHVVPSIFLSLEVSFLPFLLHVCRFLQFTWHVLSAPFDYEPYHFPASDPLQKTKKAHKNWILRISL